MCRLSHCPSCRVVLNSATINAPSWLTCVNLDQLNKTPTLLCSHIVKNTIWQTEIHPKEFQTQQIRPWLNHGKNDMNNPVARLILSSVKTVMVALKQYALRSLAITVCSIIYQMNLTHGAKMFPHNQVPAYHWTGLNLRQHQLTLMQFQTICRCDELFYLPSP